MSWAYVVSRGCLILGIAANYPAYALDEGSNDYPTTARADYVFACMAANGETRLALERCSCSIDVIASIIPYERYVQAETALSVGQRPGESAELFRNNPYMRDLVAELRRAQAEAEVECFP
ncbi:hypothetical protein MHY87_12940 [Microvirga sp. ACRRW]|uniref:hypothetical protein n=1 Tax=Microvirga sp. ACRRW TaxID=2918205 RepID=UPI001EF6D6D5|nr:hypothetical protein [Microvirga sp. ACRRW]MCG7393814.1 hypothetical protein [Microvirga sp. ACRRW]